MTARILIIAGSDSGGGAGIQADIKTVTMLGGHAMTAITAITAQNTLGVTAVHPVPTDMVMAQIEAVADDIGIDAVKIGMIGSAETSNRVADWLDARPDLMVVFDPVMVATSGSVLADEATIAAFSRLMARATITTPNLPELEALGGIEALQGPTLIKGGHAEGEIVVDRLVSPDGEIERWESPRIHTNATHGTGCTLASAIATGLGQHMSLGAAVARARDFVRLSLLNAPGLGAGHGPMGQQAVRNDGLFPGPALNQFSVPAHDYAASVLFYRTLGLTQIVDSPDNGYARFEALNGVTLSLHQVGGASLVSRPAGPSDPGHDAAAAIYFESGALDAWVAWLSRKGIRFDVMPRDQDWGWREAWLLDPAGNPVCLYQAGEYRRFPPWRLT